MRTGRVGGILLVACLAACSRGPQRHNVLLISLDSTRRDLVGAYGHQAPHAPGLSSSPNIDRLAREGVLFERAYATTSWTLPSHVTLFTGQPELVHGVDFDTHEQDPRWASLAEVLSEAGYRTAGFFSGPYLEPHFGFDRGFETYRAGYGPNVESTSEELARAKSALAEAEAAGDEALAAQRRAEAGEIQSRLETLSHRDVSSKSVTEAGLAELAAAAEDGRPFFLFLHYFDPHYDYLPPEPWDTAFDPDYDGAIDGEDFYVSDKISVIDPARPWKRRQVVSPRDLEHVLALYAGELAWTDAQIGRLREALERHELLEETIVVITSDHGDQFFEHGSLGHRENLFEESTRVPLVLRLPEPHPRGVRIDALVSNADVFPSLLELLDLPPPQGLTSRSFVPLLPDADGAGVADGAERDVLGRVVAMHRSVIRLEGSRVTLPAVLVRVIETYHRGTIKITRERSWRKPLGPERPELAAAVEEQRRREAARERLVWIDLARHPRERPQDHVESFDDPRALAALRAFRERYGALLRLRGEGETREIDERIQGQLRGLGYTGASDGGEPMAPAEFVLPPPGQAILD